MMLRAIQQYGYKTQKNTLKAMEPNSAALHRTLLQLMEQTKAEK